eukprot:12572141-Ditylum_brightwellii.AAC.1
MNSVHQTAAVQKAADVDTNPFVAVADALTFVITLNYPWGTIHRNASILNMLVSAAIRCSGGTVACTIMLPSTE